MFIVDECRGAFNKKEKFESGMNYLGVEKNEKADELTELGNLD